MVTTNFSITQSSHEHLKYKNSCKPPNANYINQTRKDKERKAIKFVLYYSIRMGLIQFSEELKKILVLNQTTEGYVSVITIIRSTFCLLSVLNTQKRIFKYYIVQIISKFSQQRFSPLCCQINIRMKHWFILIK